MDNRIVEKTRDKTPDPARESFKCHACIMALDGLPAGVKMPPHTCGKNGVCVRVRKAIR